MSGFFSRFVTESSPLNIFGIIWFQKMDKEVKT